MKKQSLISAFGALLGPPIESEIPDGFYAVKEIGHHFKWPERTAERKLKDAMERGKIERRQFRNSSGRVCWFYRVK